MKHLAGKLSAHMHKNPKTSLVAGLGVAFLLGMALVYFTPLKYAQLVVPQVQDIDARIIAKEMAADPSHFDFIDVRGIPDYQNLHAKGARNVPLPQMYFEHNKLAKSGKEIVLICSKGVASGVAFMYLQHFGFRNVVRVDGGIENWEAFGLPTESSVQ